MQFEVREPHFRAEQPLPEAGGRPDALPLHAQGRRITRAVIAVITLAAAIWITREFLAPLAWGVIIVISTWPLYSRVEKLLGTSRSGAAALLFTVGVGVVLMIPMVLAAHEGAREGERIVSWVASVRERGVPPPDLLSHLPLGDTLRTWWMQNLSDPHQASSLLGQIDRDRVGAWVGELSGQVLHRLFLFLIMLLTVFFLYRDGARISASVLDTADRLLGDPGERLAGKMVDAVRGTVAGTVVVAVAEGVLIGIAYLVAGVPSPIVLAVLTMAFAMLPFGAWVVFSAASLLLLAGGGSGVAAALVFAWGAGIMLIGDHFIWPSIVGGAARLPFLLALIGILGGLQSFGVIGLFLGPVILAALLVIWREWVVGGKVPTTNSTS